MWKPYREEGGDGTFIPANALIGAVSEPEPMVTNDAH